MAYVDGPEVLDPWADEVYLAGLEPRRRTPWGRLAVSLLDAWCATTGGRMELTRATDVVVRRREDGVEEMRIPVPDADDAAYWLDLVRRGLEELDPESFRREWGIG
ncbi:MAG: hypothetical protein CMH83_17785 [Nocardioides sp.]|nr:hypothetical protein [Nocardioides sp.]